jgi:two-component system phosphate regulon sensor histidine kinase PhoR
MSFRWRVAIPFALLIIAGMGILSLVTHNATIAWVGVVMAAVSIIIALLLSKSITKPIAEVTETAERMTSGEWERKLYLKSGREWERLAQALNRMAASLKETVGNISEERNKLMAILSNMADGVIMTDKDGAVILTNEAAQTMFHLSEDKAKGRPLIEVIRDHRLGQMAEQCLNEGQQQSKQLEWGKNLFMVTATPIYGNGLSSVLLIFHNLTELRRLQWARQELIGNISHELLTPLASIKAAAETLSCGAIDDPDATQEFLARIEGEVDRLTQLVRELVELSRIETGESKLKLEPESIELILADVITRFKPQAERSQIELISELAPELPQVVIDRERICQVLANLIHNAIKFTLLQGRVTVSARNQGDSVIVSVADTGVGISSDDLPHIFERFYKADKSHSGEGTGLGLAIAKHIVQAHKGEIWAESEEGKGSIFSFTIPITSP